MARAIHLTVKRQAVEMEVVVVVHDDVPPGDDTRFAAPVADAFTEIMNAVDVESLASLRAFLDRVTAGTDGQTAVRVEALAYDARRMVLLLNPEPPVPDPIVVDLRNGGRNDG
jgi:hypothetical protein